LSLATAACIITMAGKGQSPRVIRSGQIGRERDGLRVRLLCAAPVAAAIEDIGAKPVTVHVRASRREDGVRFGGMTRSLFDGGYPA
jgi:hypothetical protein